MKWNLWLVTAWSVAFLLVISWNATAAELKNDQDMGYCCTNGKVVKSSETDCLKKIKGMFFDTFQKASTACSPLEKSAGNDNIDKTPKAAPVLPTSQKKTGKWCLTEKLELMPVSNAKECFAAKGQFFDNKAQAEQQQRLMKKQEKMKAAASPKPAPMPIKMRPLKKPLDDATAAARVRDDHSAAASASERVPAGSAPSIGAAPLASSASVAGLLQPEWPARISHISGTQRPGYVISIYGNDFGNQRGQVRIATRPEHPEGTITADIVSWSDGRIEAEIPRSFAPVAGTSPLPAAIHVWPARVEPDNRVTPPLSTEPEPRYPYSGAEGPWIHTTIEPLVPRNLSLSDTEIPEGSVLTINGRDFTYPGYGTGHRAVRISHGGDRIPVEIVSWDERRIRARILHGDIAEFSGSGGVRSLACQLTVTNDLGNESSPRAITIERFDNADLAVDYVDLNRWTWIGGDLKRGQMVVAVKNMGTETHWGPIQVQLRNHSGGTQTVDINPGSGGLAPGASAASSEFTFNFNENNYVRVQILTENSNNSNDVNELNLTSCRLWDCY